MILDLYKYCSLYFNNAGKRSCMLVLCVVIGVTLFAQTASTDSPENPIERIISDSNGMIEIDIPEDILQQLRIDQSQQRKSNGPGNLRPGVNRMPGYRIQVFSDGRNQASLEARAKARGSAIVGKFPKYRGQIYTHSSAPNWYTRVGNFRTQQEAEAALAELKRAFPAFAGEMRIVKSNVIIIK